MLAATIASSGAGDRDYPCSWRDAGPVDYVDVLVAGWYKVGV
jgi:hypothetical protein